MNKLILAVVAASLLASSSLSLADSRHSNSRSHDRGNQFNSSHRDNGRQHANHSNVSVNLQFGNVRGSRWAPYYRAPVRSISYGYTPFSTYGYSSYNYPYSRVWSSTVRQPVVIHNTYIQQDTPTTVITRSSAPVGSSLLRDIEGRCFDREIDRDGNETRVELPAAACNF